MQFDVQHTCARNYGNNKAHDITVKMSGIFARFPKYQVKIKLYPPTFTLIQNSKAILEPAQTHTTHKISS